MTSKSSMCLVISCSLQILKAEPVRVSQRQALISLRRKQTINGRERPIVAPELREYWNFRDELSI
ncbi:hypothetical protein P5673_025554 [Acropora cervicornis]|uniref:Uncharacterized protein n=1 Tax=Acropora cervicornis TaxID=6130 RepID=A0AAD9Q2D9_ACRCE|nr:hypothetical protein P5673_025554 [Acropora cervicornis]